MRNGVDIVQLFDRSILAFADGMGGVNFQNSLALAEFRRSHSALTRQLANRDGEHDRVRGLATRMFLVDLAKDAELLDPSSTTLPLYTFGDESAEDEHLKKWLEDGFNAQLNWSLVTAFELHERLLKDLYAAVGYLDPGLWRGSDFGNTSIVDVVAKDLEWYLTQVRLVAKHDCKGVLNQLRKHFSEFGKYEETKWVLREFTSHKFWRDIIEFFRHLIVHSRSQVDDQTFWSRVAEHTGCSMTGDSEGVLARKAAVAKFTDLTNGIRRLVLINGSAVNTPTYHGLDARLKTLQEILVNHGCLAYSSIIRHFGAQPFWCRPPNPGPP